ncbi:MAG: hypothetical protein ACRD4S_06040 [Candidatus Acidiferrales bacterium]
MIAKRVTFRRLLVPLALVALLVLGTTLGSVYHHHATSSETNCCPICHLSHQSVERPVATNRTPVLAPLGRGPELQILGPAAILVIHPLPARAPPSA